MERPAKRLKIAEYDGRSPEDTGSRQTEAPLTFPFEVGRHDRAANTNPLPSRTFHMPDLRRRRVGVAERREFLPRGNAGIYLRPRVPDTTVTATVVEIDVNVGTSTISATEVPAATDSTVVAVSTFGDVTLPANTDISTDTSTPTSVPTTDATDTATATSTDTASIPITASTDTISSATTLSPAASILSAALNNLTSSTSSDVTVTVTATKTFEISYINGTIITGSASTGLLTSLSIFTTSDILTTTSSEITSSSSTSSSQDSTVSETTSTTQPTNITSLGSSTSETPSSTSSSAAASSTTASAASPGLTPVQQQVVGGVVGGVAGLALVLLIILVFLRMYRKRMKSRGTLPEQLAAREITGGGNSSAIPTSNRSSSNIPLAAAVASSIRRFRPQSAQTTATTATGMTTSTAPESETGFQRIAGRKIAPVLSAGGDGYGGNYGAFEQEASTTGAGEGGLERNLASGSFYRDSGGFYPGRASSPATPRGGNSRTTTMTASQTRDFAEPPSATFNLGVTRPEGFAVMRPSPARTPVTQSPNVSQVRFEVHSGLDSRVEMDEQIPPTPPIPDRSVDRLRGRLGVPDAVGRSIRDGSGSGSRFRERLD